MKRIGFLGAYSIDNAGDVLVGYAARQAVDSLMPGCAQRVHAPDLPGAFWGHGWDRDRGIDAEITPVPAGGSMAWAAELDALIIGGGGIVSIEPSFRPFLLGEPGHFPPGVPAAWNGVCSQNQPTYLAGCDEDYQAVRACCERLRYVGVRNRSTLRFVRGCGFAGEVNVIPDPALLLDAERHPEHGSDRTAIDALLRDSGVDPARLLVGVSIGEALRDGRAAAFYDDLFAALGRLRAESEVPCEILFFPFGAIYGEAELQVEAARRVPGARVLARPLDPLGLWRLIGRLGLHVCTRYHAMLAAFAQDVPFLVLDQYLSDAVATSKIREFIADGGLEAFYLCPLLSLRPAWKLEGLFHGRAQVSFRAGIIDCQRRLRDHYRSMLASLGLT
jgi:hypothetical protein